MHEGTQAMAFLDYKFSGRFTVHGFCTNLLDVKNPMGSQSPGVIDPAVPRCFGLSLETKF